MTRYLLVPESMDMDLIKKIDIPSGLITKNTNVKEFKQPKSDNVGKQPDILRENKDLKQFDINLSRKQKNVDILAKTNKHSMSFERSSISKNILNYVKRKTIGEQLLKFIRKNKIMVNKIGEIVYQGSVIKNTCFEELFTDLVDAHRKSPPKNHKLFYDILKGCNIKDYMISKKRRVYFK